VAELEELLVNLRGSCDGSAERPMDGMSRAQRNAHKKYLGLLRSHARYFLAAGPGGRGYLFEVDYGAGGVVRLSEAPMERLRSAKQ